jgi:putative spermidine/putrescine transport system permease protein
MRRVRPNSRIALYSFAYFVAAYLIVPTLVIIPMSFTRSILLQFPPRGLSTRWYAAFFDNQTWTSSALTSLEVATLSMLLATALGTLTALGLVRGHYRGRRFVNGLVLSPLLVPLVVVAVGMQLMFTKWNLTGSLTGFVAAHTALAIPFVVVNVGAGLQTIDPQLELAARTLGAPPLRAFWRVTLPLLLPSVAAGALFAFITSWDEVVVAIFLSSPIVRTLPVVMWSEVHDSLEPTIAAVASMLTGLNLVLLLAVAFTQWRVSKRVAIQKV